MIALRENDVVRYTPPEKTGFLAGSDRWWCVEGMGVVRPGPDGALRILDNCWISDRKIVEPVDVEVVFNLDDFDALPHHDRYRWERYAPYDRAVLTGQHGHCRQLYVRKGAVEDDATIIANAAEALEEAERALAAARRMRDWRQEELDALTERRPAVSCVAVTVEEAS